MKTVSMLGEGAWGTAVATLLANNGISVKLWCHDGAVADSIQQTRCNKRYLPGAILDPKIKPVTKIRDALSETDYIFESIPVIFLREVVQQAAQFYVGQPWVVLSKGIEQKSLLFPTELIDDVLGTVVKKGVVAGPSFAQEVAEKKATAVTLATECDDVAIEIHKLLTAHYFKLSISDDLVGVQVGGALKNVITLAIGMLEGAGCFGDNTKAFVLTEGLREIAQVAQCLGGKHETLYGLSGIGDLVLTSMGSLSKNLSVGRRLGQGQLLETVLKETGFVAEGVNTTQSLYQLAQQKGLNVPVCLGVYEVLTKSKTIQQVVADLMR